MNEKGQAVSVGSVSTGSGSDSVEAAKAFVGTDQIAKCLTTLKPGYGYMEVSFGPRRATITRVEHRDQSPNNGDVPRSP